MTPFTAAGSAKWAVSTAGGSAARWSHRGDELFYLDAESRMVAARVASMPTFAVVNSRVLFDASVQVTLSRRNYDIALDDQRFLMVQRADGARGSHIVVIETG